MIGLASTLIFVLSAITLYVLILNRKNIIILFVLIPLMLTSSLYTGYTIYALQGTPISGTVPTDVKVEIVWFEASKPWIYLLLRVDGGSEAVYYRIAYDEKTLREIQQAEDAAKQMGQEEAQGKFLPSNNGDSESDVFTFILPPDWKLPPKTPEQDPSIMSSTFFERL